ncbi:MAG: ATP-binding protein [Armatimonadota bacterium]|nr:ATP-binding protein [Armatimonadota bacterium]
MRKSQGLVRSLNPMRRHSCQCEGIRIPRLNRVSANFTQSNQVEVRFKADMEYLAAVRLITQKVAEKLMLSNNSVYDLKLAVGEACANAIEHGSPLGSENDVAVTFSWTEKELRIEIADQGTGCWIESKVGCGSDRGFGIPIMRALMDQVDFVVGLDGTKVILTKRLR